MWGRGDPRAQFQLPHSVTGMAAPGPPYQDLSAGPGAELHEVTQVGFLRADLVVPDVPITLGARGEGGEEEGGAGVGSVDPGPGGH